MIVVQTTIPIDPAAYDEAIEHITDLVDASRASEGTVHYSATEDLTERNTILFFEVYEDADAAARQEALDAHRRFVEALPDVVDGDIESIQFETDDVHRVEFTAAEAVAAIE